MGRVKYSFLTEKRVLGNGTPTFNNIGDMLQTRFEN